MYFAVVYITVPRGNRYGDTKMSVMIGVPIKDAAVWLPRFLYQLDKLSDVSRIVFIYGTSQDPTLQMLQTWENETAHVTEIIYEPAMGKVLSAAEIALLYEDFQSILGEEGWEDETHFMLLDSDIMDVPEDLVQQLKEQDKDIIAPFVWVDRSNPHQFFDVHCFRLYGYRFHPFDPPDPYDGEPFEVDSVGSCYLVKREVFDRVAYENPHPHMKFCENAVNDGYEVWAHPGITIQHLDPIKVGITKTPIELLRGEDFTPPQFIKKDGTIVSNEMFAQELIQAYVWGTLE
jgi:hypothetical protein